MIVRALVLAMMVISTAACQSDSNNAPPPPPPPAEGSSSGGGSFGNESAKLILKWASEDLSRQIELSSPEIYRSFPAGWTQKRLAQLIANVDYNEFPEVSRHGERLMLDYRVREDGTPYILGTQLFANSYSHFEVNARPKHEFYHTLEQVKLKLAHEAAHHMGLGLKPETDMPEARAFALALLDSLDRDNFECVTTRFPSGKFLIRDFSVRDREPPKHNIRAFVINRPTGRGISPHGEFDLTCDSNSHCSFEIDSIANSAKLMILPNRGPLYLPKALAPFDLLAVYQRVIRGLPGSYVDIAELNGTFSWPRLDPRKAVREEAGYVSGFDYENSQFKDFLDLSDVRGDESIYTGKIFADRQESPIYDLNFGEATISIRIENGEIKNAELVINYPFVRGVGGGPNWDESQPLKCIRSGTFNINRNEEAAR